MPFASGFIWVMGKEHFACWMLSILYVFFDVLVSALASI